MPETEKWRNVHVGSVGSSNMGTPSAWRVITRYSVKNYDSAEWEMDIHFTRKHQALKKGDRVRLGFNMGGSDYGTITAVTDDTGPETQECWIKLDDGTHCTYFARQLTLAEPDDVIE